jgi:hypothetical protein
MFPLAVIGMTVAAVFVVCACLFYWYGFLQKPSYSKVYQQLGISDMPLALEAQPAVQTSLDQLSHEPCYRNAIVDLADALLDAVIRGTQTLVSLILRSAVVRQMSF